MPERYDFLVVGAGFAGSVSAERLASKLNKKVLLVEKRGHIGGNAYDFYDDAGILVHKYGAHCFHTNYDDVWDYVRSFGEFNNYVHRVRTCVDGKILPIPINLTTVNALMGKQFSEAELRAYFETVRIRVPEVKNSRDVVVSVVGEYFYEKFFKNYTFKQWGVYPDELSPEVTSRIPIRYDTDDRYFSDKHQGMPKEGFFKLFEKILNHKNITVITNTDYKDVLESVKFDKIIYTGPVDYFFDHMHGKLPYRSQSFEFETHDTEYFQEVAVVNYPNDFRYTKITESKHFTYQKHHQTTIVKEYPEAEGEPYYPMPMENARKQYERYAKEAEKLKTVYFAGRLAQYRYYNMDQAIKQALDLVGTIAKGE
ncbi:MAG: UDP-galactopyranose mutase [Nitrospirae bacterium]|nr:UDP-galactopyranose mutase [Nitrospirota bacterium]